MTNPSKKDRMHGTISSAKKMETSHGQALFPTNKYQTLKEGQGLNQESRAGGWKRENTREH